MRYYTGTRSEVLGNIRVEVWVSDENGGKTVPLNRRIDLVDHKAAQLNWGRGDPAGSSQLALALLADALGDDKRAKALHRKFQARYIDGWNEGQFTLTQQVIRDVCAILEGQP